MYNTVKLVVRESARLSRDGGPFYSRYRKVSNKKTIMPVISITYKNGNEAPRNEDGEGGVKQVDSKLHDREERLEDKEEELHYKLVYVVEE